MIQKYIASIYKNDEDRRMAGIIFRLIVALLVTYLVVILASLYWNDRPVAIITLLGGIFLLAPLGLLYRGAIGPAGILVVLIVLATATILATMGQGIHDLAIMTLPVIVIVASLMLSRRNFFIASALVIASAMWLVFGEALGWFVSKPYLIPEMADFIVVAAILLVTILTVDMLAENMREGMRRVGLEIIQRKRIENELRHQSIHDALTGIHNRSFFEDELARLEKSQDYPVSIIVGDLDDLKMTNDTRGHSPGDELLKNTARVLRSGVRSGDVLARIGGDEFGILLPHTDAETAKHLLARLRSRIIDHNTNFPDLTVKISLGTATAELGKLTDALMIADQNMYADKASRKHG